MCYAASSPLLVSERLFAAELLASVHASTRYGYPVAVSPFLRFRRLVVSEFLVAPLRSSQFLSRTAYTSERRTRRVSPVFRCSMANIFMETLQFSNQSNELQGFCGRGLDFDFGTRDRILFVCVSFAVCVQCLPRPGRSRPSAAPSS